MIARSSRSVPLRDVASGGSARHGQTRPDVVGQKGTTRLGGGAMRDAVIVAAVRTPVGKRNGALAGVHPVDLSAHVLNALAERSGTDPAVVGDVIGGCVS